MHYQPVIDRFPVPIPLDPIAAILFVAAFAGCALATLRRPAYGLSAIAFIQPFAFAHSILGTTISFPKAVLLGAAVGLATRGIGALATGTMPVRRIAIALGAIALATMLTMIPAQDHIAVLRETFKALEYLLLLLVAAAAYALDPDDRMVLRAFGLSAIAVCLSALVQELIGAPSGLKLGEAVIPRIAGVVEGPNQLAGYLEIVIATFAAWHVVRASRITATALGLAAATLILTFSRGGLLGAGIVVVTLITLDGMTVWRSLTPLWMGAACGAAGAGVWALLVHSAWIFRFLSSQSSYSGGVGNRAELWRAAWTFFRAHPLLGIGAGNYEMQVGNLVYGVRTHANSWYLQSLAEGGIVLFGATVGFIVTAIATLARHVRRSPWTIAAFAATIALVVHQIFDFLIFYPKVGGPWIILIALGVAASAIPRET